MQARWGGEGRQTGEYRDGQEEHTFGSGERGGGEGSCVVWGKVSKYVVAHAAGTKRRERNPAAFFFFLGEENAAAFHGPPPKNGLH